MRRPLVLIAVSAALVAAPALAQSRAASSATADGETLNPQPLPPRAWAAPVPVARKEGAPPAVAKPVVGQKTGIIIVGGKPVATPESRKPDERVR